MRPVRFRYNASIAIAGAVGLFGAVPLAAAGFYNRVDEAPWWAYALLVVLLIPVGVILWGARSGTDAGAAGVRIRPYGLVWTPIAWSEIVGLVPQQRRVYAILTDNRAVPLPAVSPGDIPQLIAASGAQLTTDTAPAQAGPDNSETGPDNPETGPGSVDEAVARAE